MGFVENYGLRSVIKRGFSKAGFVENYDRRPSIGHFGENSFFERCGNCLSARFLKNVAICTEGPHRTKFKLATKLLKGLVTFSQG